VIWICDKQDGVLFFPDKEFRYSYEDYSCGEMAALEYEFSLKEQRKGNSEYKG